MQSSTAALLPGKFAGAPNHDHEQEDERGYVLPAALRLIVVGHLEIPQPHHRLNQSRIDARQNLENT